jgi:hypothetical protein
LTAINSCHSGYHLTFLIEAAKRMEDTQGKSRVKKAAKNRVYAQQSRARHRAYVVALEAERAELRERVALLEEQNALTMKMLQELMTRSPEHVPEPTSLKSNEETLSSPFSFSSPAFRPHVFSAAVPSHPVLLDSHLVSVALCPLDSPSLAAFSDVQSLSANTLLVSAKCRRGMNWMCTRAVLRSSRPSQARKVKRSPGQRCTLERIRAVWARQ